MEFSEVAEKSDIRAPISEREIGTPDKDSLSKRLENALGQLEQEKNYILEPTTDSTKGEREAELTELLKKLRGQSTDKPPIEGESTVFDERLGMPKPADVSENTESESNEARETREVGKPIQNKIDGLAREHEVEEELREKYPESEGYTVVSEAYLRDKDGNIVKDPVTGEARRIDFVVIKEGKVVDSVEVTSKTADKTEQTAKEERIRESGGNYVRDGDGNLVEIPGNVHTRIERRD